MPLLLLLRGKADGLDSACGATIAAQPRSKVSDCKLTGTGTGTLTLTQSVNAIGDRGLSFAALHCCAGADGARLNAFLQLEEAGLSKSI